MRRRRPPTLLVLILGLLAIGFVLSSSTIQAQSPPGELPEGPKPLEDFEVDADNDGIPDGWYNLRDAKVAEGGVGGSKSRCFRFENARPGRPARASRAFGVDGRLVEAVVVGLWVRQESIVSGERSGDEPGLLVDFYSDPLELKTVRRGSLGPWKTIGPSWTHVVKKMPIPPQTRLAILSVGLLGATGVVEVDNMTIDLIPVGGKPTTNLVVNGDFEMGDPEPLSWLLDRAQRIYPGYRSDASVELRGATARVYSGLALPVGRFRTLEVSAYAKGNGLRGANGAMGLIFFLDEDGKPLPGMTDGVPVLNFSGSFGWQNSRATVDVPPTAVRALVQFEKVSSYGTLQVDDVQVTGVGGLGEWTPDHVETGTSNWLPMAPSPRIVEGSALDASGLLEAPAGKNGFVAVKEGRLHFASGARARFLGVSLIAPTAFTEPARADELAERLARSGVNLVRLADLDTPLGPARSLLDDTRDDTQALDPEALGRLDHLIAAFKARGIYVAIELQSARKFREGDDPTILGAHLLPAGGGPAAAFSPSVREAARKSAEALLTHVNSETGLALRDDPVLAWVTLAGELTMFDLPDAASKDYKSEVDAIRNLMRKDSIDNARRGWQAVEGDQWKALAADLRKLGVKVPIAGGSHWKRDYDYNAAQTVAGLDLIDDRLYQSPNWAGPERRSLLWSRDGGLGAMASKKRKVDRPYVVGQWAEPTFGAWATPYEAADLLLLADTAAVEDWDAVVRRGVFIFPRVWGAAAAGTGGGEDIFTLSEVVNGIPQTFAMLPHASSILLHAKEKEQVAKPPGRPGTAKAKGKTATSSGWDPRRGRLAIDTPHTQGLAGWVDDSPATFETISIQVDNPYGVIIATSLGKEPIATSKRLLVTAVARVEPTGFQWLDEWKRERAEPGRPPLLQEPLRGKLAWRRAGTIKAYALDNTGNRIGPAPLQKVNDEVRLNFDGRNPIMHWELVVE